MKTITISQNTPLKIVIGWYYPCSVIRGPSAGGGLGVFAFHDVPSRRFAPRSVCFLRLKDAFGGIEISFLLGAPL